MATGVKPIIEALNEIRKHTSELEFLLSTKEPVVEREKKAQAKHVAYLFEGNEEFSFAVGRIATFRICKCN
jgi:hypothetical protein